MAIINDLNNFFGNVYVNLEDANRIFYIVNGDFFNYGTTTWNAGASIGVGKATNVKFGVSNASNHYQYRYVESRVTFIGKAKKVVK